MNVYLKAADLLCHDYEFFHRKWHGGYSCNAIAVATGMNLNDESSINCREANLYGDLFSPPVPVFPGRWLDGEQMSDEERHQWRLTALCFAAAMHDTGDL